MIGTDRRQLFGLAVIACALAASTFGGVSGDLLLLAPALVFALPLLAGRYLGERQLARLAAAFVGRRRRPTGTIVPHVRRGPRRLPRGGRLIAAALAVRPPPAAARCTA